MRVLNMRLLSRKAVQKYRPERKWFSLSFSCFHLLSDFFLFFQIHLYSSMSNFSHTNLVALGLSSFAEGETPIRSRSFWKGWSHFLRVGREMPNASAICFLLTVQFFITLRIKNTKLRRIYWSRKDIKNRSHHRWLRKVKNIYFLRSYFVNSWYILNNSATHSDSVILVEKP